MNDRVIREGLTFDDVLLAPGASDVLPSEVKLECQLTREISLNIPLASAAHGHPYKKLRRKVGD